MEHGLDTALHDILDKPPGRPWPEGLFDNEQWQDSQKRFGKTGVG